MKKSYLIYALAIIILSLIYTNDNAQQQPNYTRINADSLFLENDERYITTTNDSFTNQSLKDHITLVFFGYTNCPDFCPDTLIKMSTLFKSLNKYNENKKLQLLFISIDPKDKTEVIKKYVEYFDKDFIGMSMDENNLEQLIKKTGVYAKKVSSDAGMDFYDHTGAIFYVGQNAKILGIYTPPIVNDLINKDIVRALK